MYQCFVNMTDPLSNVFYGNVFDNIIIDYISVRDIFNLKFVNRSFRQRITESVIMKIIKTRIERKLKVILKNNYDAFVNAMAKSKAILSGSFILQCILNEKWSNSDIDIYVDKENENFFHKCISSITSFSDFDYGDMYGQAFNSIIHNIKNFFIDPDNNLHKPNIGPFDETKQYFVKIQVVTIKTSKEYSLIDHTYNTGFDVCKNRLTYDKHGKMQLYLKNYKEAITKTTTFTIQTVDDFYYRVEKYSKRGFYFKPKYNKLLYLEYLYLHFSMIHVLRTDFDEKIYYKLGNKECGNNCAIKLFFRNRRHYHSCENGEVGYTTVENNDRVFNRILPQLMSSDYKKREELRKAIWKCKDIGDYAKIRNNFANIPFNVYNNSMYKYDIQYGLPSLPIQQVVQMKSVPHKKGVPQKKKVQKKERIDWLISSLKK